MVTIVSLKNRFMTMLKQMVVILPVDLTMQGHLLVDFNRNQDIGNPRQGKSDPFHMIILLNVT